MTELLHPELTGISRRLVLALCTLPGNTAEEAENNYAEIYDNDSFKAYNVSTRMLVSGAFKITEDLQRKVKGYRRYQYLKNTYTLCLKEKFSARVKAAVMDYLSGNFAALVKAAKGELTFSDLGGMDEVLMEHLPHDISGFTLECGAGNSDSLDFPDDILTKKELQPLLLPYCQKLQLGIKKTSAAALYLPRLQFKPPEVLSRGCCRRSAWAHKYPVLPAD